LGSFSHFFCLVSAQKRAATARAARAAAAAVYIVAASGDASPGERRRERKTLRLEDVRGWPPPAYRLYASERGSADLRA